MASETLGAEELPRERHRWSENFKVYTRKFNRTKKNSNNNNNSIRNPDSSTSTATTSAAAAAVVDSRKDDDNNNNYKNDTLEDNIVTSNHVANGTTSNDNSSNKEEDNNDKEKEDVGEKLPSSPPRVLVEEARVPVEEARVLAEEARDKLPDLQENEDARDELPQPQDNEDAGDKLSPSPSRMPVEEANSSQPPEDVDAGDKLPPSPPRMLGEDANSFQPQENSVREGAVSGDLSQLRPNILRLGAASGDSSSLNRAEAPVPNGHDGNLANGSVSRPLITQVDDRMSISVSAARSKDEVRGLKRKLVGELDQVRKMAKRLEVKENQVSRYSSIGAETTIPVVDHMQFPVNGGAGKGVAGGGSGMRMTSETHSAGYNDARPFRRLSVSVMNNNNHPGVIGEVVEKEKRTPKANQYYRNSEFLLGKDRLPPAESNKKAKSAGGKKHSGGDFDFNFRIDKKIFSKCSSLLQKIMNHKHGWVFNQPVDVKRLGLHDYFDIIKHPMDLGTVKARLTKNWYKTPREFAEDVRLTFHNALTYNPAGQDVHIMAQDLLRVFEEKWPAIESEYDRKLRCEMIRDLGVPTPTSRKTYAPAHVSVPMSLAPPPLLQPPPSYQEMRNLERSQSMPIRQESRPKPTYSVGRKPVPKKPKAKDPHKRDMTFDEKQRLSTHLQSLPSEKLDAIVQIIKKRNSALSQHDDEIEVDIDSVDAETLWELDRFVTNYKKSLSKHKRKAELAQARAAAAAAAQATQQTIQAPANVEAQPRETTADKGNVAASPRAQQEERRTNNNASGSSSSSSSSSDSGSSSSDSDSDSSSGSDSDGGH
ncbi:Transcription factor GTE4 [Bienertia sinuspersici]